MIFFLIKQTDDQLRVSTAKMEADWNLSKACEEKLTNSESENQACVDKRFTFDQQISSYKTQISELQKKIADAERQKGPVGFN